MSENSSENVGAEVAEVLKRYREIQEDERRIKEEKAALQQKLAVYMKSIQRDKWYPEIGGEMLKVTRREKISFEYDEEILKQRLAERYHKILAPDLRKLRHSLDELGDLLEPVIERVGSPTPEKIREAVEAGVVEKQEFAGAFERTVKTSVSVAKCR
jgi:hypothetical protein